MHKFKYCDWLVWELFVSCHVNLASDDQRKLFVLWSYCTTRKLEKYSVNHRYGMFILCREFPLNFLGKVTWTLSPGLCSSSNLCNAKVVKVANILYNIRNSMKIYYLKLGKYITWKLLVGKVYYFKSAYSLKIYYFKFADGWESII